MIEHPWTELQLLIKEKWLTQKEFSSILWKKVSELNELLKWKRNITIQRDYLLHQTLWTPMKYWILKQIDYDYSLLDIEEPKSPPLVRGDTPEELGGFSHQTSHSEHSEESTFHKTGHSEVQNEESFSTLGDWKSHKSSLLGEDLDGAWEGLGEASQHSEVILSDSEESRKTWSEMDSSADKSASEWQPEQQETPTQEPDTKDDEDLKNRAKIFRTF